MSNNNQDILRDPIWQFIGVVVGIVTIFIAFLTLPSSVQGIALVGILVAFIILAFALAENITKLSWTAALFLFIGYIWFGIIATSTYYHVLFFSENFGLDAPGVVYAKSNLGLTLLMMQYILWSATFLLFIYLFALKESYIRIIGTLLLFMFLLFGSIPNLYLANFVYIKVLGLDFFRPKTIWGVIVCLLGLYGYILLFFARSRRNKRSSHLSK